MKKLSFKSIVRLAAAGLNIASLILILVGNSVTGYAMAGLPLALTFCVAASIAFAAAGLLPLLLREGHFVYTIVENCAVLLSVAVFGNVLLGRAALIAAQFTYDSVNATGWQALIPGLIAMGTSLFAAIAAIVVAFLKDKESSEVQK